MPSDFFVPSTISNQAQLAMAAFSLELRTFDLPRPDDFEGWRQTHASFEELFQPLFFIDGVLERIDKLPDDKKIVVLNKVQSEINNLIDKLGDYFEIDTEKLRKQD